VFQYSSKISPTLEDLFYVATAYHTREQWEPGAADEIVPNEDNIRIIIAEKKAAVEAVEKLHELLRPETLGLPEHLTQELITLIDLYPYYVKTFYYAIQACFLVQKALYTHIQEDLNEAQTAVQALSMFRIELTNRMKDTFYPYYIYWMLDENLLLNLEEDLSGKLKMEAEPVYEKTND